MSVNTSEMPLQTKKGQFPTYFGMSEIDCFLVVVYKFGLAIGC